MQAGHFFIQLLGQRIDLLFKRAVRCQADLGQDLVGEAVGHDKAGMSCGAAKVHEASLGQDDDGTSRAQRPLVNLGLDIGPYAPFRVLQVAHLNFVVEMAYVADYGLVLHAFHVLAGNDVDIAGAGHVDVGYGQGVFHSDHFIAFHGCLQGADGIYFGDKDAGAEAAHGLGAALAHVAVAADHDDLAGHHDVCGTLDAVCQGFAAAVEVVELGLGDAVIDVEGREKQAALLGQLVEPVHACRGLFADTLYPGCHVVPVHGILGIEGFQPVQDDAFLGIGRSFFEKGRIVFAVVAHVYEQGGIAAVIDYKVGACAVRPGKGHFSAPPVVFERLALPGKNLGIFVGDNGSCRMILGGEDIAGSPSDIGTKLIQGTDKHGSLDGHVQ